MLPETIPRLVIGVVVFCGGALLCMGIGFNSQGARDYRAIVALGAARLQAAPASASMLCVLPAGVGEVNVVDVEPASAIAPAPVIVGRRLLVSVAPGAGVLHLRVDGAAATAGWRGAKAGAFVRCGRAPAEAPTTPRPSALPESPSSPGG